jgi:hypothetical protein
MTSIRKAILAGVLFVLAAPTYAEEAHHTTSDPTSTQPPAPAAGVQPGMGMMSGEMMPMMGQMSGMLMAPEHIEGRIAFLKTELKITAGQEALWRVFADVLRSEPWTMEEMAKNMQGVMAPGTKDGGSLIERLDRHERMLSAHLDHLRRVRTALEPLYDSLDAAQRHSADELVMPMTMGKM